MLVWAFHLVTQNHQPVFVLGFLHLPETLYSSPQERLHDSTRRKIEVIHIITKYGINLFSVSSCVDCNCFALSSFEIIRRNLGCFMKFHHLLPLQMTPEGPALLLANIYNK